MQAKSLHVKSRHPHIPLETFRKDEVADTIETSPLLPESQRAWSCPLCNHGLPELPTQARNRAIRAHCSKFHPKETPKTLSFKNRVGTRNQGCSAHQTKRREKERQELCGTHTIVKVIPVEKRQHDPVTYRGHIYYCKFCFSRLRGSTAHKAEMTCQQRQEEMQTNGFVLSRKRAWWTSWLANEPLTAQNFLDNSGLTKEHMCSVLKMENPSWSSKKWKAKRLKEGYSGCGKKARKVVTKRANEPKSSKKKSPKSQAAKWREGGKRGLRIGEAKHPGPLRVCCVNSQEDPWSALRSEIKPDIWLFQETWFTDNSAHAFCRTAKTHGYNGYFQNGPRSNRGINTGSGGSAVFVRQGIPQRFGARFDLEDSQGIFVWVDGLFVGSIYAPPYEHCSHGATNGLIQAFVEARVLDSTKWLIGGDFNETPQ